MKLLDLGWVGYRYLSFLIRYTVVRGVAGTFVGSGGTRVSDCSEPVNLAEAGAVTLARLRIQFLLNNFINLNARTVFF